MNALILQAEEHTGAPVAPPMDFGAMERAEADMRRRLAGLTHQAADAYAEGACELADALMVQRARGDVAWRRLRVELDARRNERIRRGIASPA